MFKKSYYSDGRLEIIILGAMRGAKTDPSTKIKEALEIILKENTAVLRLSDKGIGSNNTLITVPEEWQDQNIEDGVFSRLDTADLVILNITPKKEHDIPSPNVFYELALVHTLGIPYLIVVKEGTEVPFYIRNSRYYATPNFGVKTLVKKLRQPLLRFLDDKDPTSFTDNILSRFYEGLPVIDISATVGLATGYYMNFVRRVLKDGSFITLYPDKIKKLIVIRPYDIFNTYEQDWTNLKALLEQHNMTLDEQKYPPNDGDKNGHLWFYHVAGIVIDLPRTIYPLKQSPRLLSLRKRLDRNPRVYGTKLRREILSQAADKLLDKMEDIIKYHIRNDNERIRETLLHFSSMEELPNLIRKLQEK